MSNRPRTFLHTLSDALEKGVQIETMFEKERSIIFRLTWYSPPASLYGKMTTFKISCKEAALDETGVLGAKELIVACRRLGVNIED